MKRLFSILVIVSIMMMPLLSFAFQNEPDGFRGIKWGTNIDKLSRIELINIGDYGDGRKVYKRRNDKMAIGEVKLNGIFYCFWKNQFSSVGILCVPEDSVKLLKNLEHTYGEGDTHFYDDSNWVKKWSGKDLEIFWGVYGNTLDHKFIECFVSYSYKPIEDKMIAYLQ